MRLVVARLSFFLLACGIFKGPLCLGTPPSIEALISQASRSDGLEEQLDALRQLEEILSDEAQVVPIHELVKVTLLCIGILNNNRHIRDGNAHRQLAQASIKLLNAWLPLRVTRGTAFPLINNLVQYILPGFPERTPYTLAILNPILTIALGQDFQVDRNLRADLVRCARIHGVAVDQRQNQLRLIQILAGLELDWLRQLDLLNFCINESRHHPDLALPALASLTTTLASSEYNLAPEPFKSLVGIARKNIRSNKPVREEAGFNILLGLLEGQEEYLVLLRRKRESLCSIAQLHPRSERARALIAKLDESA